MILYYIRGVEKYRLGNEMFHYITHALIHLFYIKIYIIQGKALFSTHNIYIMYQ